MTPQAGENRIINAPGLLDATRMRVFRLKEMYSDERLGPAVTVALSAGLFAQVAQIVMFREMLAACRGTEIFFGVVMASGLFWGALGAAATSLACRALQRRGLSRDERAVRCRSARCRTTAVALFAFNGLLLMGQIAIARFRAPAWGGAADLTLLQSVCLAVIATGPVAFSAAAQVVLAFNSVGRDDVARLYQWETYGACCGALVFTFALVEFCPPILIGPLVCATLCCPLWFGHRRRWGMAGALINVVALIAALAANADTRLHQWRWSARFPGYSLVVTRDSRYGQLAALKHPDEDQYSLYSDGGLAETLPAPNAPPIDEAAEALFAVAQHPHPARVLLVGGAGGALPGELERMGVAQVGALEMDPGLAELACELRPTAPGAETSQRAWLTRQISEMGDPRYYIKRVKEKFDGILLKLPAPLSGGVNRYYTREFFEEAQAALNKPGVLILSLPAAANYEGETVGNLSASVLKTLQSVFPEVVVVPGEVHVFVAGTQAGIVSLDPSLLAQRVAQRGIVFPGMGTDSTSAQTPLYRALFENMIPTGQVERLRQLLEACDAPINTDARPIAYQFALRVWNQIVSARLDERDPGVSAGTNAFLSWITGITLRDALWIPVGLAILSGVVFFLDRTHRTHRTYRTYRTYTILVAAAMAGLFGMASEVAMLFAFQNAYGYAYAQVGVIVAVFMAGMALGAGTTSKGRALSSDEWTLAGLLAAMAVFCVAFVPMLHLVTALQSFAVLYGVFMLLSALAGILGGASYPVLVRLLPAAVIEEDNPSDSRAGGWVYAVDLAGAGFGALATGGIGIPMLGTAATLGIVALLLAVTVALCGAGFLTSVRRSGESAG